MTPNPTTPNSAVEVLAEALRKPVRKAMDTPEGHVVSLIDAAEEILAALPPGWSLVKDAEVDLKAALITADKALELLDKADAEIEKQGSGCRCKHECCCN